MSYLSATSFLLVSALVTAPWAMVAAGFTSLSTALTLNTATGLLVSAAWWSQAHGQFEPSIARVLYEAEHEADSQD